MAGIVTEPGRAHGQGATGVRERKAGRRRALSRRWAPWLALAAGLGASVPTIAATVEGLREGATPTGDRAIIATRAYDVFSSHTPLVGQFSASSLLYDHLVHSLGPLLYWLLAVPVRIGAAAPPTIAMGAMNVAAVLGAVALARRPAGAPAMVGAAVAVALMCGSLSPETLHDVWNPSAGLLPFTLLLFACWGLACGQRRLLPVAVLAASFAAQSELVFLAPSATALALGMAGLLSTRGGRRAAWRWWLAALVVAAACWSAPIVDELSGHPGNLTVVTEAAFSHGHTIGMRAGWRAVVHTVGVPPWWLSSPRDPFGRLADLRSAPARSAVISCVAVLAALVAVLAIGIWRRRRELAWASAIALALCLSLAASTASTPSRPSLERSLGYMLWVGSPIGMWAWLTLALAAVALVAGPLSRRLDHGSLSRGLERGPRGRALGRGALRPAAVAAGVGVAWAAGVAVAAGQGFDQDRPEYGPVKVVQAAVRKALEGKHERAGAPQARARTGEPGGRSPRPGTAGGSRTVLVTGSHRFTAFDFRAAVIYDLRRRGWRVYAPAASERLGSYYAPPKGGRFTTVWVFDEPTPPRRGRVIEHLRYGAPASTITVMISGAGEAPPSTRR